MLGVAFEQTLVEVSLFLTLILWLEFLPVATCCLFFTLLLVVCISIK